MGRSSNSRWLFLRVQLGIALALCVTLAGCSLFQSPPTAVPTSTAAPAPTSETILPVALPTAGPEIPAQALNAVIPTLYLYEQLPAVQWHELDLPVNYISAGHSISSISFTIEYDSNRLYFDNRDLDNNGLPDAIRPGTASGFAIQFRYEPQGATSRLTFAISDLIVPIRSIPDGVLLNIRLLPKAPGDALTIFTTSPPVVYRDLQNQVIAGQAIPGSVEIFESNRQIYLALINNRWPPVYSITGQVTQNGQPRPGVVLQVQTGQIAWSDANGNYLIANLPPGAYSLLAILPNTTFNPPSRIVNLPPNSANQNFAASAAIPTPSPTVPRPPTPTSPGPRCEERIFNGGFESTGGWVIPSNSYPAAYVTSPTYQGSRSMRTGIPNSWENRVSSSWVYQEFVIPFNATSAVLKFYIYPKTGEPSMSYSSDRQTVRLLNQNNTPVANLVGPMLGNQGFWMFYQYDLRNFKGSALRLSFETYNDGVGSVTWMFSDAVSLVVCF